MKCRPEHVVALASEFDSPFGHLPNRPRSMNSHTILSDSIAMLLVSQPRKQSIAVGIQPDVKSRRYTLVVSSNCKLGKETALHAHDVWNKLKTYAECYHGCSDPVLAQTCKAIIPERIDSLLLSIYRFSFPRLLHYLRKPCRWRTRLEVFLDFASHPSVSGRAAPLFNTIAEQLYRATRGIVAYDGRGSIDDNALKTYIEGVDAFFTVAKYLIADSEVNTLIPQLEASIGFDPLKFIRRVISFSASARSLMGLVLGKLSYSSFAKGYDLEVKIILCRNSTIKLRKPEDWAPYAEFLLNHSYNDIPPLHLLPDLIQPGRRLNNSLQRRVFVPGQVHPVCSVALHLFRENRHRRREHRVRSLAYIGTSRQSCLACVHFVRSLINMDGHAIFRVRETYLLRAKFPWKYPNMEIAETGLDEKYVKEIRDRFLTSVGRSYARHFTICLQRLQAGGYLATRAINSLTLSTSSNTLSTNSDSDSDL